MPPKWAQYFDRSNKFFNIFCSYFNVKTSISEKILNNNPFPSITGFEASGPISPKPKTAVPFEITATKFPFAVYLYTLFTSFAISKQGSATPGE